jgi:RNA polymerase sigma-70 factor (ECF subfamily)
MADSEQRLVWLARTGDREAFSELVSLFESKVYRAAYALTGRDEDAKDLSQETFVRAYRAIGGFRGKSSFYTWLYGILLNRFRTLLRKRRRMPRVFSSDQTPELPADCGGSYEHHPEMVSNREAVDRVYKAISSLPYEQKMAMVMHCLEEMTYKEIARAMRCPVGTVKSRIHAARLSLKRMLAHESDFQGRGG